MTPEERDRLTKAEAQLEEQRRVNDEIRETLKSLLAKVEALTAEANKGKGALAVIVTASGTLGALISWAISHLTFH